MTRNTLTRVLPLFLTLFAAGGIFGQEPKPDEQPPENDRPAMNQPQDPRFNLLRQLGLSREQIQRIRRMNAARRPLIEAAQARFREANRALDEAIYSDQVSEEDIKARLKDVQLAQAEMIRIRSMDELAVRRLLTPEQLVRFRELRARFDRARDDFQTGRPIRKNMPQNGYAPQVKTTEPRTEPVKNKP